MTRAQSDTIGFVLVFSLVVLTVGTVYAAGYPALVEYRSQEQLQNMERAFVVLDGNLDDMAREGAPSRATEIKLNGGTLSVNGTTTVTVNAVDNSTEEDVTVTSAATPIAYTRGDTTVVAVHGAVVRRDGDAAVMRRGPGWVFDDDRAVISLVSVGRSGSRAAFGGTTTVVVRGNVVGRSVPGGLRSADGADIRVNVTVSSPRAGAWKRYFESRGLTPVDAAAADGTVTYQYVAESVLIQQTTVAVQLDR
ncbi:DUF7289 family protein [Halobaculum sp. EA56]|uniref:DUF7289 family protein n=1 Tax=Halobaculum sp. EA56 TaxID=3421648 RepID=UPI003EB75A30